MKKIISSIIIVILGLSFMQYKGWISFTPEGKKMLKKTLHHSIKTSRKIVHTLIELSEEEQEEEGTY